VLTYELNGYGSNEIQDILAHWEVRGNLTPFERAAEEAYKGPDEDSLFEVPSDCLKSHHPLIIDLDPEWFNVC